MFTNKPKSSTTFANRDLTGVAAWDDAQAAWDDHLFSWDAAATAYTNQAKSRQTTRAFLPFFGWLFWFTVEEDTVTDTIWTNRTKN